MTEDMLRTAVLYSAEAPNEEQTKRFEAFVRERYGEDVDFRWEETPDMLGGGFRLKVGSEVYDWSVEGRFQQLKEAIQKVAKRNDNVVPLIKETIRSWTPWPPNTADSSPSPPTPTSISRNTTSPTRRPERSSKRLEGRG